MIAPAASFKPAIANVTFASGHRSTPGFNDPAYPIEGRRTRASA